MYTSLGPGAVGIERRFPDAAALAADAGFDAIQVDQSFLLEHGPDEYRTVLDEHGLRTGSFGIPVDVTGDRDQYESDLEDLDEVAERAAEVGCTRATTYLMSFSDERDFAENFEFHRKRLEPIADILDEYDVRFGLEYLGPQTIRDGHEYEFIHTSKGMLELCEAVGDNVGLLLDAWHWHTAGESGDALETLDTDDVVDVHVNDAPSGLTLDQFVDTERAMPGETGVIDIETFLDHLDAIGYDGPVMAEPFDDELAAMDDETAARETKASLDRIWERAGL